MGATNRYSQGERMQMLIQQDRKETREIIKELAKNNAMLQDVIAKSKEEVIFLGGESRILKSPLGASGGGAENRRENLIQKRCPGIKTRREDGSTTDEEHDPKDQSRKRKKRMAKNEDTYTGKKRKIQLRFEREHLMDQGRGKCAVDISRRESRQQISPSERTIPRKEESGKPIDGERELNE